MTANPLHPTPAGNPVAASAEMILSEEQLVAVADWVESGRVRLRRRVVSETRTVEVVVRREELVVETLDAVPVGDGERYRGTTVDGPAVPHTPGVEPLVIVLRQEIPEVVVRAQAYARITAHVDIVTETGVWHAELRREELASDAAPTSG